MVRWIVWVTGVVADGTGVEVSCFFRVGYEVVDVVWIGGDEEVTPAIPAPQITTSAVDGAMTFYARYVIRFILK